jgi:hypothetical protein
MIPILMQEPFQKDYSSLTAILTDFQHLGLTYYFIYNAYKKTHENHFSRFFDIVDINKTITNENQQISNNNSENPNNTDIDFHNPMFVF